MSWLTIPADKGVVLDAVVAVVSATVLFATVPVISVTTLLSVVMSLLPRSMVQLSVVVLSLLRSSLLSLLLFLGGDSDQDSLSTDWECRRF